ncbi:MAG: FAD-dependent oxidoreductase [Acidobacteria bacterium]|nr:FAD-dependent oxidoreductase [Acidobacteriota bacterium]
MLELRTDVTVVGAGPAGVAAAVEASESGARVVLVDDNPKSGGQIWRQGTGQPPAGAQPWLRRLASSTVEHLSGTAVVDVEGARSLFLRRPDGLARVHTGATVLATGSRERFLPFPGWTLPGVMGAGGAQALAKSGWPVRGTRIVVAGSGPLLLAVAHYLKGAGAQVTALVEQAPLGSLIGMAPRLMRHPRKLKQAMSLAAGIRGVRRLYSSWVEAAQGEDAVSSVTVRTPGGRHQIECELVACGFGLVPETRLARLCNAALAEENVQVDSLQRTDVEGLFAAGEITGVGGVDVALAEGRIAGLAAAGDVDAARALSRVRDREQRFAAALEAAFELSPELGALATDATVVCRCEDVTLGELRAYEDARDAKLKTRCGMGACQARMCGPAMRFIGGWKQDSIRPPLFPIETAALAEISAAQTSEAMQ